MLNCHSNPAMVVNCETVLYMLNGEDHYCMGQKNGHLSLLLIAKEILPPEISGTSATEIPY